MPEGQPGLSPEIDPTQTPVSQRQPEPAPQSVSQEAQEAIDEANAAQEEADREAGVQPDVSETELTPEAMRKMLKSPEGLVDLVSQIDHSQYYDLMMREKHKGRFGRLKQLVAEGGIKVSEEGEVSHSWKKELLSRAVAVITDKKILASAGISLAIGALTGGFGAVSGYALGGMVAGRATGEAAEAGFSKSRDLRMEQTEALMDHLPELKELAEKAQNQELSEQERFDAQKALIDKYYETSNIAKHRTEELTEEDKKWDKRKGLLTTLGGVAGLASGFASVYQQIMTVHLQASAEASQRLAAAGIDPNAPHYVKFFNGVWNFAYNSGEVFNAMRAGAHVASDGVNAWHVVGDATSGQIPMQVAKNAWPHALQAAGIVGGMILGNYFEQRSTKGKEERAQDIEKRHGENIERWQDKIGDRPAEAPIIPEKYQQLAAEEEKSAPEKSGEIWVYQTTQGRAIYSIESIDWNGGTILLNVLDSRFNAAEDGSGNKLPLERRSIDDLIRNGWKRSDMINDWLLGVKDGDKVLIDSAQQILDRSDASGRANIEPEEYIFTKVAGKSQAELSREGKPINRVSIFDLALWGVKPIMEARRQESAPKIKAPKVKEKWGKRTDVGDLPTGLKDLPDVVTISGIDEDDGTLFFKEKDAPVEDVRMFVRYFKKVNVAASSSGGDKSERGAGGRGRGDE